MIRIKEDVPLLNHVDCSDLSVFSNPVFEIEYEKFPEKVNKIQRRLGGISQQRLKQEEAIIFLAIKMLDVAQVTEIRVFVQRLSLDLENYEYVSEPVELAVKINPSLDGKYHLQIDLDSVYMVDGKKIYALSKNNTEEKNIFNLRIVLFFLDGSRSEAYTKSFKIIGKDVSQLKRLNSEISDHEARSSTSSQPASSMESAVEFLMSVLDEQMKNDSFPHQNYLANQNSSSSGGRIFADELEARRAEIEELTISKPIKTARGDIAYHFILKDPSAHPLFEEGETVGLFINNNGQGVLDKLSNGNSHDAVLKGIITRSHFLEAKVEPEGVRTETICILGIVPVRVRGPVIRGDVVYASKDFPGTAVSGASFNCRKLQTRDASAIGLTMETINCDHDELNLIQCFVSVTFEIFQGMMEKRMANLTGNIDSKVNDIQTTMKKSHRRRIACFSVIAVFLMLLAILLWQVFMPGSAFRYWICRKGSILGHSAKFQYVAMDFWYTYVTVKGLEFRWKTLKDKTKSLANVKPISKSGFHYYFNVDRCAYGSTGDGNTVKNDKLIGGPHAFAVNKNCTNVYYYDAASGNWCNYRTMKNLFCHPMVHREHQVASTNFLPKDCIK